MVQEGVRRLLNTSVKVPACERNEIMDKFVRKLINSEFTRNESQTYLVHATTSYVHKLIVSELPATHPDHKPLFRGKLFQRETRLLDKALSKTTWFRGRHRRHVAGNTETGSKTQANCWKTLLPKEWKETQLRQRHIEGLEISTVMMVPNTAESKLLNELIKKEAQLCKISGYYVKLIEGNGTQLCRMFPQPFSCLLYTSPSPRDS